MGKEKNERYTLVYAVWVFFWEDIFQLLGGEELQGHCKVAQWKC